MDNADRLDALRRGKAPAPAPTPALDDDLRDRYDRWQWIRGLRSGVFALWEHDLVADLDATLQDLQRLREAARR